MTRPTYERAEDRRRQRDIIEEVAYRWRASWKGRVRYDPVDYDLYRGGALVAKAEVKARPFLHATYPDYMLSAAKWRKACSQAAAAGVPLWLVVGYTDGCYCTRLDGISPRIAMGGRQDRGDPRDMELCIYVLMKEFRRFGLPVLA